MDDPFLFLLIFGGVGGVLLLIAAFLWIRVRSFVAGAVRAKGTVVRLAKSRDSEGDTVYAPVVEFTARGGGVRRFTDPMSTSPAGYRVGQRVEVLYDRQDHDRARLASKFRLYFAPALLGFLGLVFTCVGVGIMLFSSGGLDAGW
ncbi:MAG: DUF3592 domain-containing protein [Acidobacteria bacterium]|nr:DUF3592 domain-containing protein [Acidobacteriota bacterium]